MEPIGILAIGIIVLAGIYEFNNLRKNKDRMNARNCIKSSIEKLTREHQKTLLIKRSQLIIKDDYGLDDRGKWVKELEYFVNTIIMPIITPSLQTLANLGDDIQGYINAAYRQIEELLDQAEVMLDLNYKDIEDMNPIEYEHYCADLLREQGWEAKVTKASGDQGVDIVATKGRLKIAVQCKLYAKPVGNKAVQEIQAGAVFVEADYGVVVAPKGFTRSAKELAKKTGVRLMHHSELSDIVQAL